MIAKAQKYLLIFFFIVAGINHFLNAHWYYPLIPPYLPFPVFINYASGLLEIAFGAGLLFTQTRKWAAYGIIGLLIAFIPAHIHFIVLGGCVLDVMCLPVWVGWVRLLVIHPLLMYWVWVNRL